MQKGFKKIRIPKNLILLLLGIFILLVGVLIIWVSSLKIPDFRSFEDRKVVNSTKIYDRTGKILLYDIHQDVKSAWKLTQDRELVKKRSIEKQGFIHTCEAIGTSLRHIFQTFSEHEKFAMWIIKKNGAPGLENSQLTLFDHSENGGHREDVEQILDIEYNIEELQD